MNDLQLVIKFYVVVNCSIKISILKWSCSGDSFVPLKAVTSSNSPITKLIKINAREPITTNHLKASLTQV